VALGSSPFMPIANDAANVSAASDGTTIALTAVDLAAADAAVLVGIRRNASGLRMMTGLGDVHASMRRRA
jgi:hypothetical protein